METCEECDSVVINIDNYGERLIGCYKCNKWRRPGEVDFARTLPNEDVAALRKIDAEEETKTDAMLQMLAAKQAAKDVASYIARGRYLKPLSETELKEKFTEGVRQWTTNRHLLSDVYTEYDLRDHKPPNITTVPEFAAMRVALSRAIEEMPQEQMDKIAAELRAEAAESEKDRH
jgi:hypothetical protein